MSFFDRLLDSFGLTRKAHDSALPAWAQEYAETQRWTLPDASLYTTQATLYQKLTWIATAIDRVAEAAGVVSFDVKKRRGEDTDDIPNHPFETLLQDPNPLQSRFEFMRDAVSYYKLTGNVYIYLNRSNEMQPPAELWIVPTHLIKPIPDGRSFVRGYLFETGASAAMTLEPWQICHIKTFNPMNPFVGLSFIQSLAIVSQEDIARQIFSANLYAKDNAKIPGALAFADRIADPEWERLKAESAEKWGGTQRKGPMMIRGAGAGGVQWVQMSLGFKEMQFLEARKFTKEEIWSKLAPGLASITDVTATEANAIAGKGVFAEFALYPMLVAMAQRFAKDILPTYGEDLICEPDDVRLSNRLMDLSEQKEYSLTHTIDEIRSEYYGDDGLTDERGDLLPAQIAAAPVLSIAQPAPGFAPPSENQVQEAQAEQPSDEDIKAELDTWERFAVKRIGKTGRDFKPRVVPIFQAARIQSLLKAATTAEVIGVIFDGERKGVVAPNAPDDDKRRKRERQMQQRLEEYFVKLRKRIVADVK